MSRIILLFPAWKFPEDGNETIWDEDRDVSKASTALSRLRTFGKQYKIREFQIEHYIFS